MATHVLLVWQTRLLERAKRLEGELYAARAEGGAIRQALVRRDLRCVAGDLAVLEELASSLDLTPGLARAATREASPVEVPQRKRASRARA